MTKEQFSNELNYCGLVAMAGAMLARGDIGEADYIALRQILMDTYRPVVSGLRKGGTHSAL